MRKRMILGPAVTAAIALLVLLALSACAPAPSQDAACTVYAARRIEMPRPLPADALGRWVAVTDAGMTGACR